MRKEWLVVPKRVGPCPLTQDAARADGTEGPKEAHDAQAIACNSLAAHKRKLLKLSLGFLVNALVHALLLLRELHCTNSRHSPDQGGGGLCVLINSCDCKDKITQPSTLSIVVGLSASYILDSPEIV